MNLLITTAFINENRYNDYIESFESVDIIKDNFNRIDILECCSKSKVDYLENTKYNVHYSDGINRSQIKGENQMRHIYNFIINEYNEFDSFILLTGRYRIINDNFFNFIDCTSDIIAKSDGDIYSGIGVHTFYIYFKVSGFIKFYNWYISLENRNNCIEHDVKKFIDNNHNCKLLNKSITIGVETNIHSSGLKIIC